MSDRARPTRVVITAQEVSQQPVKHHYEAISQREFKSTIPPHLLSKLPEDERFMVETMSKLEYQFNWLAEWLTKNNESTIDLHTRVTLLEAECENSKKLAVQVEEIEKKVNALWDWQQYFRGKWAVLAGSALIVAPILVKFLLEAVIKWLKH